MITDFLLCLVTSQVDILSTTTTNSHITQSVETLPRMLIEQGPCGDNPSNTYFISKDSEFSQISECAMINSSVFINGEYDITTLNYMENNSMIHGDLVIQNSHNIYNLKGLQNLNRIVGEDLYLDQYSLYITDNENMAFVDKVNWSKITDNDRIFLDYTTRLDRVPCYDECDGCYGPGPYLCQSCLNYKFIDNRTCTGICENIISNTSNLCQVRPPNRLFLDYMPYYSSIYLDWGSNDLYRELIDGYQVYYNGTLMISTFINDNRYFFDQNSLIITDVIHNLIPGSVLNCSVLAHSKFGYSELLTQNITLKTYTPDNYTDISVSHPDNSDIIINWSTLTLPDEVFFQNNTVTIFYEYYLDTPDNSGITYNNSITFNRLYYGNHVVYIKTVVQVNDNYFSGEYQEFTFDSFYTTTSPTSSPTSSATTSQSQSSIPPTTRLSSVTLVPSVTSVTSVTTTTLQNETGLPHDAFITLVVFMTLLGIGILGLFIYCHKDKKKRQFMDKMKDPGIVNYSNPVYETNEYNSYDYSDGVVINRDGSQANPIYEQNYSDPEKDYYTI